MSTLIKTKTILNRLRMSPRKVRLLTALIQGRSVKEAELQLRFAGKAAARPVLKLLQSAVANARHNHGLKTETLMVKSATVDGGPILYRWQPRAMGRATPVRKRTSQVTIVLQGERMEEKKSIINQESVSRKSRQDTNSKSEARNPKETQNTKI